MSSLGSRGQEAGGIPGPCVESTGRDVLRSPASRASRRAGAGRRRSRDGRGVRGGDEGGVGDEERHACGRPYASCLGCAPAWREARERSTGGRKAIAGGCGAWTSLQWALGYQRRSRPRGVRRLERARRRGMKRESRKCYSGWVRRIGRRRSKSSMRAMDLLVARAGGTASGEGRGVVRAY